jgi:hypothetical protein
MLGTCRTNQMAKTAKSTERIPGLMGNAVRPVRIRHISR